MEIFELEEKYDQLFWDYAYEKYSHAEDPIRFILLPDPIGGPRPFRGIEEETEAYRICIREGKPWQEIPELRDHILAWYKEYLEGMADGADY